MPKSELARKGKVAVPEEEISSDEEQQNQYAANINTASLVMAASANRRREASRKMLSHGTAEWERVRYIDVYAPAQLL